MQHLSLCIDARQFKGIMYPMTNKVGEITHTHPVPRQWDELVAFSEGLLDPSNPLTRTPEMSALMLVRLDGLDNEELDTHRYYGIGLIMCGIAQALRNAELRAGIIRRGGERLHEHWLAATATSRIEPRNIEGLTISGMFGQSAILAGAALPPAVQLLNDSLLAAAVDRRLAIKYPGREDLSHLRRGRDEDGAIELGVAARAVGEQAATAASAVLQTVLENRAAFVAAHRPEESDQTATSPSAVQIMDEAGPKALALDEVGVRCASLRVDEFRNDLNIYLDVDKTGAAVFRRDRMVPAAQLKPPATAEDEEIVLHTRRLRCPAMFVEDLIPVMLGMTQAIVREADRRAQGRIARHGQ